MCSPHGASAPPAPRTCLRSHRQVHAALTRSSYSCWLCTTISWPSPVAAHSEAATREAKRSSGSVTMGQPPHSTSQPVVCALQSGVSRNRSATPLRGRDERGDEGRVGSQGGSTGWQAGDSAREKGTMLVGGLQVGLETGQHSRRRKWAAARWLLRDAPAADVHGLGGHVGEDDTSGVDAAGSSLQGRRRATQRSNRAMVPRLRQAGMNAELDRAHVPASA